MFSRADLLLLGKVLWQSMQVNQCSMSSCTATALFSSVKVHLCHEWLATESSKGWLFDCSNTHWQLLWVEASQRLPKQPVSDKEVSNRHTGMTLAAKGWSEHGLHDLHRSLILLPKCCHWRNDVPSLLFLDQLEKDTNWSLVRCKPKRKMALGVPQHAHWWLTETGVWRNRPIGCPFTN